MTYHLRVQTILFENSVDEVRLAYGSLKNSLEVATSRKSIDSWSIVWGDCSPEALLTSKDVNTFTQEAHDSGGEFIYQHFAQNLGHGGGQNTLARKASNEDLLLFLNPDLVTAPELVVRLVSSWDNSVGAVDARQIPLEHPKEYDAKSGVTSWASGACFLTKSSIFTDVDGFDHKNFYMYGDDVDLSWRIRLAGYKVLHQPAAVVFHDKRLTTSADSQPSRTELYYSLQAVLNLAEIYSRPDWADVVINEENLKPQDFSSEVIEAFLQRRKLKDFPPPRDLLHEVAEFYPGGLYAKHRF